MERLDSGWILSRAQEVLPGMPERWLWHLGGEPEVAAVGKPTPSHRQAIYKPSTWDERATHKPPSCDPHATFKPPPRQGKAWNIGGIESIESYPTADFGGAFQ